MTSRGQGHHGDSLFDDSFYNVDESRTNSLSRTVDPTPVVETGATRPISSRPTITQQRSQAVPVQSAPVAVTSTNHRPLQTVTSFGSEDGSFYNLDIPITELGSLQQRSNQTQPSTISAQNGHPQRQSEPTVGGWLQNEFNTSSNNISVPTGSSGASNIELSSLTPSEIAEIDGLCGISSLYQLMEMGFSPVHGRIALKECDGDVSRAITFCLEHGPEELQWLVRAENERLARAASEPVSVERNNHRNDNTNTSSNSKKGLFGRLFRGKSKQSSNTSTITSTQQQGAAAFSTSTAGAHARPVSTPVSAHTAQIANNQATATPSVHRTPNPQQQHSEASRPISLPTAHHNQGHMQPAPTVAHQNYQHHQQPQPHIHVTAPMNPNFVDIPPSPSSHHPTQSHNQHHDDNWDDFDHPVPDIMRPPPKVKASAVTANRANQMPQQKPAASVATPAPTAVQGTPSSAPQQHYQQPYPHINTSSPSASTAVPDSVHVNGYGIRGYAQATPAPAAHNPHSNAYHPQPTNTHHHQSPSPPAQHQLNDLDFQPTVAPVTSNPSDAVQHPRLAHALLDLPTTSHYGSLVDIGEVIQQMERSATTSTAPVSSHHTHTAEQHTHESTNNHHARQDELEHVQIPIEVQQAPVVTIAMPPSKPTHTSTPVQLVHAPPAVSPIPVSEPAASPAVPPPKPPRPDSTRFTSSFAMNDSNFQTNDSSSNFGNNSSNFGMDIPMIQTFGLADNGFSFASPSKKSSENANDDAASPDHYQHRHHALHNPDKQAVVNHEQSAETNINIPHSSMSAASSSENPAVNVTPVPTNVPQGSYYGSVIFSDSFMIAQPPSFHLNTTNTEAATNSAEVVSESESFEPTTIEFTASTATDVTNIVIPEMTETETTTMDKDNNTTLGGSVSISADDEVPTQVPSETTITFMEAAENAVEEPVQEVVFHDGTVADVNNDTITITTTTITSPTITNTIVSEDFTAFTITDGSTSFAPAVDAEEQEAEVVVTAVVEPPPPPPPLTAEVYPEVVDEVLGEAIFVTSSVGSAPITEAISFPCEEETSNAVVVSDSHEFFDGSGNQVYCSEPAAVVEADAVTPAPEQTAVVVVAENIDAHFQPSLSLYNFDQVHSHTDNNHDDGHHEFHHDDAQFDDINSAFTPPVPAAVTNTTTATEIEERRPAAPPVIVNILTAPTFAPAATAATTANNHDCVVESAVAAVETTTITDDGFHEFESAEAVAVDTITVVNNNEIHDYNYDAGNNIHYVETAVEASAPAIFFESDVNIAANATNEDEMMAQQIAVAVALAAEEEENNQYAYNQTTGTYQSHTTATAATATATAAEPMVSAPPLGAAASAPPIMAATPLYLQSPGSSQGTAASAVSATAAAVMPVFDRNHPPHLSSLDHMPVINIQATAVFVPDGTDSPASSSTTSTHNNSNNNNSNSSQMNRSNHGSHDNLGQLTSLRRRQNLPHRLESLRNGKVRAIVSLKQLHLKKSENSPQGNRPDEVVLGDCANETIARDLCECFAPPLWASKLQISNAATVNTCMLCQVSFSMFSQPHHCRNCGYLVCGNCSEKTWPGSMLPETFHDDEKYVRVCHCCHVLVELFVVALCAGDYQTVRALYATGNVNLHQPYSVYTHQAYPVHYAVLGGNLDILRWLIDVKRCSIINQVQKAPLTTHTGWTLLGLAAHCGHVDMVRFLVHEKKCQVTEIKELVTVQRALHALLEAPGALPEFTVQKNAPLPPTAMLALQDDLLLMLLRHHPRLRQPQPANNTSANNSSNSNNNANNSGIDLDNNIHDYFSVSASPSGVHSASNNNNHNANSSIHGHANSSAAAGSSSNNNSNSNYHNIPVATATEAPVIVSHIEAAPVTINSFNLPSQVNLSATHWTLAQLTKPLPKHRWLCAQAIFRVQEYLEMQRRSMFYTLPPAISHPPAGGAGRGVSVTHHLRSDGHSSSSSNNNNNNNNGSSHSTVGDVVALASLVGSIPNSSSAFNNSSNGNSGRQSVSYASPAASSPLVVHNPPNNSNGGTAASSNNANDSSRTTNNSSSRPVSTANGSRPVSTANGSSSSRPVSTVNSSSSSRHSTTANATATAHNGNQQQQQPRYAAVAAAGGSVTARLSRR